MADFAKLIELFDAHGVSFVSVTQQFNTTTSMGRLTLNVLLSFACGLKTQPPGTEFWDPETGRQKSPLGRLETCRDRNPKNERLQIPAESARMRVGLETRGLRRLLGGVHSPMRTGLSQPTPVIPCYLHFFRDKDPCLLL